MNNLLKVDDKHWSLTIRKGEGVGGFVEVAIDTPLDFVVKITAQGVEAEANESR